MLDEAVLVDLSRDEHPQQDVHDHADQREPQPRPPRCQLAQQVGHRARQEPEGQQVYVPPAEVVSISAEIPPSLRSRK